MLTHLFLRELLRTWADYLVFSLPDPGDQLCTDDFEGPSPHNVNLALKVSQSLSILSLPWFALYLQGIVALGAYSYLLKLNNQSQDALKYDQHIKSYVQYWVIMASVSQPSHFCFFSTHSLAVLLRMEITIDCSTTYPTHGLSSTIYCFRYIWLFQQLRLVLMPTVMIYYQVVLGLDVFPESVIAKEEAYYQSKMYKVRRVGDSWLPTNHVPFFTVWGSTWQQKNLHKMWLDDVDCCYGQWRTGTVLNFHHE